MAVYNSHNTKQWEELLNAINGGDTSAIATALDTIKTSIDSITTSLGNLSIDVEQDSTQWTNLITAISQSGGGVGNVTIDSTQWTNLITAINTGDTSAIATALDTIKTSIDSITTSLGNLSIDVEQDSTQWLNLINAITNQSLNVDLSNITSSVVRNLSNIQGNTITDVLNSFTTMTSYKLETTGWTIYKKGYICMLKFLSAFSTDYTDGTVITTLPYEYRPSEVDIDKPIYNTSGVYLGTIRIRTTGDITPVFGKLTAGTIRDTFCYIV